MVEVPAADPPFVNALEAVAAAFVSPEYVYLFLVVVQFPKANIPTVEFPAAAPKLEIALDAVADVLESFEYVYFSLVVVAPQTLTTPMAKIPTVLFPTAAPYLEANEAFVALEFVQLE